MTTPTLDRDGPDALLPWREAERTRFLLCHRGATIYVAAGVERVACECGRVWDLGSD